MDNFAASRKLRHFTFPVKWNELATNVPLSRQTLLGRRRDEAAVYRAAVARSQIDLDAVHWLNPPYDNSAFTSALERD